MSPLQFQKQLRLQEARRLLLSEDIEVTLAAQRVGYASLSQFSREYRRLFGPRAAKALAVYEHAHDHTHLLDGRVRLADGTIVESCDHEHGPAHDRGGAGHA